MTLRATLIQALPSTNAVAVSGGLDSWVLALLLRQLGRPVRAYTLATSIADYCELPRTTALAAQFQVPLTVFAAPDLEAALPRFLALTRTPIYNLHPVSKLLLAEALRDAGVPEIIGGDAADQVFRGETTCDLLPLTLACFAHAGVRLHLPFQAVSVPTPDPDKQALRALAADLGLPPIAKKPTLVPGPSILNRTTEELARCAALRA
jgi:asparagine synthase (glutamine-hydrolysing)